VVSPHQRGGEGGSVWSFGMENGGGEFCLTILHVGKSIKPETSCLPSIRQ